MIAPKRPQVVPFKASTVRSGSALPSLHQNSQPMSQGTYSASSFIRSNTRRAASITSCPTPSPGIQAIRYFAIRCRSYRRHERSQGGTRRMGLDPLNTLKNAKNQRLKTPISVVSRVWRTILVPWIARMKRIGSGEHTRLELFADTGVRQDAFGEAPNATREGACATQTKISRAAARRLDFPRRRPRSIPERPGSTGEMQTISHRV